MNHRVLANSKKRFTVPALPLGTGAALPIKQ